MFLYIQSYLASMNTNQNDWSLEEYENTPYGKVFANNKIFYAFYNATNIEGMLIPSKTEDTLSLLFWGNYIDDDGYKITYSTALKQHKNGTFSVHCGCVKTINNDCITENEMTSYDSDANVLLSHTQRTASADLSRSAWETVAIDDYKFLEVYTDALGHTEFFLIEIINEVGGKKSITSISEDDYKKLSSQCESVHTNVMKPCSS